MNLNAILQLQSLTVGYNLRPVLSNINLELFPGQFVSLVAPNGAGKSTLLKTIAGVLPPIGGKVLLKERSLTSYKRSETAKKMAVVSSETAAPGYTALQVVNMGRFAHLSRFSGLSAHDRLIVRQAMEDVDVWNCREALFSELSQGERQKVVIAQALAQQPEILLLDEPTAHLDINNQYGVLQLIGRLALNKKIGVIAVIHDINQAIRFSTHILFLKDGNMVNYGPVKDVLSPEILRKLYGLDFRLYSDAVATYVLPVVDSDQ